MKKIIYSCASFLLFVILYVSLHAVWSHQAKASLSDSKGISLENVKRIFEHLGVSVSTIDQAHAYAQEHFLRKGERWDIQEQKTLHALMQDKKDLLLHDLTSLGMIDTIEPQQASYTYVLVMGATKPSVKHRLDYVAELKHKGLIYQTIVLLGGERPLQEYEKNGLPGDIITESQMMHYLCMQHSVLKDDSILLVNAPMIKNDDATFSRPTTDSTIAYFAEIAPVDGPCLVISQNPYVLRQTNVAQRMLNQARFPTHGTGKKVNRETVNIIMVMDEFARLLYEECKKLSK